MEDVAMHRALLLIVGLGGATAALAGLPVYLESQDGIGNGMKECVYSDRSVVTVKADAECPPSNASDPAMDSNEIPDVDDDQNEVDD
jgi:hypothetical protein